MREDNVVPKNMDDKYLKAFGSLCDSIIEYFKDIGYTKDHVVKPNPLTRNYFTISDFIKLEECCTSTTICGNIGRFEFVYDVNENPNMMKLIRYIRDPYDPNVHEEHIDMRLDEKDESYIG